MAIRIYTGLPGSGKTYVLVRQALKFLKKGVHVWTNFSIKPVDPKYMPFLHYWRRVEDLRGVKNGIILMDEAQIYFNSRKWADLPSEWQYKLQQHRKEGLHIFGTVQNIKRIDTIMRELVSHYYECSKFFNLIFLRQFKIDDANKKQRSALWLSLYFLRKKYYKQYDTRETIDF